jgi:hypothetical protein
MTLTVYLPDNVIDFVDKEQQASVSCRQKPFLYDLEVVSSRKAGSRSPVRQILRGEKS